MRDVQRASAVRKVQKTRLLTRSSQQSYQADRQRSRTRRASRTPGPDGQTPKTFGHHNLDFWHATCYYRVFESTKVQQEAHKMFTRKQLLSIATAAVAAAAFAPLALHFCKLLATLNTLAN